MGALQVIAYATASALLVFLLHHLYEHFKASVTVRRTPDLANAYAKKFQTILARDRARPHPNPAPHCADYVSPDEKSLLVADLAQFANGLGGAESPNARPPSAARPECLPPPVDPRTLPDVAF